MAPCPPPPSCVVPVTNIYLHIQLVNTKNGKKTPCKRWEIANVFHQIEKTDFQAFDFLTLGPVV